MESSTAREPRSFFVSCCDARFLSAKIRGQVHEPVIVHVIRVAPNRVDRRCSIWAKRQGSQIDVHHFEGVGSKDGHGHQTPPNGLAAFRSLPGLMSTASPSWHAPTNLSEKSVLAKSRIFRFSTDTSMPGSSFLKTTWNLADTIGEPLS